MYENGVDMWRDLAASYGREQARNIACSYLDLQAHNDDAEELQFCRELYAAMMAA